MGTLESHNGWTKRSKDKNKSKGRKNKAKPQQEKIADLRGTVRNTWEDEGVVKEEYAL